MTPRAVVSRSTEYFPTTHSDLRATWHPEADTFVLSLWAGGRCTGSAPLTAADAGRLLSFMAHSLAARATMPARAVGPDGVGDAARRLARAVRHRAVQLRARLG